MSIINLTFIIGNGFDLNCGMHTSYKDIYKEFKKEDSPEARKLFDNGIDHWGDYEIGLVEHANEFDDMNELADCNCEFASFITKYLTSEEKRINDVIPNVDKEVAEEMERSITNFCYKLPPIDEKKVKHYGFTAKYNVNFISLNYTSTLRCIINRSRAYIVDRDITINYPILIHGNLEEGVIIGADSLNQFTDKGFVLDSYNAPMLVKEEYIKGYDVDHYDEYKRILNSSDVLCIFGASLGLSDISIKYDIIEWLKTSDKHHLIKYYKKGEKRIPNKPMKMVTEEKKTVENFSKNLELMICIIMKNKFMFRLAMTFLVSKKYLVKC